MISRRRFGRDSLIFTSATLAGLYLASCKNEVNTVVPADLKDGKVFFKLSLAQWSFHKALQGGKMDHLEFADKAKALGFDGIEYVNQFFKDKATDNSYLHRMNVRARSAGVEQLIIMVDGEGGLATPDKKGLAMSIENHKKWVDAASTLGCHSIRVNCHGKGTPEEVAAAGVEGLSKLSEIAAKQNVNVIVENHGGYSSDGQWMSSVIEKVNMDNCGTLPDFGNFCVEREGGEMWGTPCIKEYDKYRGVKELLPYAKAVSAKAYDFDEKGMETTIDYKKMLSLVKLAGYKGYIGVEYEGEVLPEEEGIVKTRDLLLAVAKEI